MVISKKDSITKRLLNSFFVKKSVPTDGLSGAFTVYAEEITEKTENVVPQIDGIERTVDVVSAHLNRSLVRGENIIVCGGGLSGYDFALEEAQNGKKV